MADERRLNFDAEDDIEIIKRNLLNDVAAATKEAKDRKEQDRIRDAQLATQSKDRKVMFVIIAVAAVIIFAFAYWLMFVRGESNEAVTNKQAPVNKPAVPNYRMPPPSNYNQQRPVQVPPQSEPVRRNPSDTYDDGPESGAM